MKWFHKVKNEIWFQVTLGLSIVVILYLILQHLSPIWNLIKSLYRVISPLIVGAVIAYIIDALVRFFERSLFLYVRRRSLARKFSIVVAIIVVLLFVVILLILILPYLIDSLEGLISNISTYVNSLKEWLYSLWNGVLAEYLDTIDFNNIVTKLVTFLSGIVSAESVITASISIGSGLVSVFVSAILAVYYLLDKERLIRGMKKFSRLLLKKHSVPFINFCSSCNRILIRYVCCSLLEALMVGVANALLMLIFGMPYIPIISIIVAVTNLAPTFGPIAGAVIGGFILLLVNPWFALIFIIITIVLQMIDGYIVKPKLFSGTLGVSSLLILVSIIVLGRVFGVVGMLCAIPFAAIMQYIIKRTQRVHAAADAGENYEDLGIDIVELDLDSDDLLKSSPEDTADAVADAASAEPDAANAAADAGPDAANAAADAGPDAANAAADAGPDFVADVKSE